MGILGVVFFSVMTISRVKFSGLDWDLIQNADFQDLIYGLFAETNLISDWLLHLVFWIF